MAILMKYNWKLIALSPNVFILFRNAYLLRMNGYHFIWVDELIIIIIHYALEGMHF